MNLYIYPNAIPHLHDADVEARCLVARAYFQESVIRYFQDPTDYFVEKAGLRE